MDSRTDWYAYGWEVVPVKTARFAEIVKAAGKPDVHLLLTDPALDPVLQKAIKAGRVMTVHQTVTGQKPDFGTVGFVPGVTGQILIFPKTIHPFDGRNVVGIKYDLLKSEPPARRSAGTKIKKPGPGRARTKPHAKIVHFPRPALAAEEDDELAGIKAKVRQALDALADGKQVAAYHLLQTILKT